MSRTRIQVPFDRFLRVVLFTVLTPFVFVVKHFATNSYIVIDSMSTYYTDVFIVVPAQKGLEMFTTWLTGDRVMVSPSS